MNSQGSGRNEGRQISGLGSKYSWYPLNVFQILTPYRWPASLELWQAFFCLAPAGQDERCGKKDEAEPSRLAKRLLIP